MTDANSLFEVLFKLALPVGVLSFLMIRWTLKTGLVGEADSMRALSKEIDALAKKNRKNRKDKKDKKGKKGKKGKENSGDEDENTGGDDIKLNPVHSKWMKFGGGFYGIVALYTYGLIEWNEIRETVAGFGGVRPFFAGLDIGVLINMFIEGLMNFIAAISWPVYWMAEFGSRRMWMWMAIAYGAYWLGMRAARTSYKDRASFNN